MLEACSSITQCSHHKEKFLLASEEKTSNVKSDTGQVICGETQLVFRRPGLSSYPFLLLMTLTRTQNGSVSTNLNFCYWKFVIFVSKQNLTYYIALANLKLTVQNTVASDLWQSSCLSLQGAEIKVCAPTPSCTITIMLRTRPRSSGTLGKSSTFYGLSFLYFPHHHLLSLLL